MQPLLRSDLPLQGLKEFYVLIVDDILLSPVRGLVWVLKKVQKAAEEELDQEGDRLTAELSELYMMVDTGRLSEDAFEKREKELLDRLDEIEDYKRRKADEMEAAGESENEFEEDVEAEQSVPGNGDRGRQGERSLQ